MHELVDPDWYLDHVLIHAEPGPPPALVRGPVHEWRAWWAANAKAEPADLLRVAVAQGFVLSTTQLRDLGTSRARQRTEVRHGRWTGAGRGMVAPIDVRDPTDDGVHRRWAPQRRHALSSAGAALRRPRSVVSGRSAAILHGLPTMRVPVRPELNDGTDWDGRRSAVHLYPATLDPAETTRWYGIDVEDVGRTLVGLARHGRRDAIMAADAALREGLVDRAAIRQALDTAVGWPWVRQARAVLALADPRAESPLESVTRLALHDSGFPAPRLQVCFGGDRVDFFWPEYGLVLEADGRLKYVGDASWKEKQRERRLRRHPEVREVERVTWADVTTDWQQTAADLRRHFR